MNPRDQNADNYFSKRRRLLITGSTLIVASCLVLGAFLVNFAIKQHQLRLKRGPVFQLEPSGPYIIDGFHINEVMQFLAQKNEQQYFHNPELKAEEYKIHAQMKANFIPLEEMEALASKYDLRLLTYRNDIHIFTPKQFESRQQNYAKELEGNKTWQPIKALTKSENASEGFFIRGAFMNDVIQYLAESAQLNYFHNPELSSSDYVVTGHLSDTTSPNEKLQALALAYGLKVIVIRDTVYVFTLEQFAFREPLIKQLRVHPKDRQRLKKYTPITKADDFFIRKANLNEVAQFIADEGNLSYWHNPKLNGRKYQVIGHLQSNTAPLEKIQALALTYNLTVAVIDGTIHIFTAKQFASRQRSAQQP